MLSQAAKFSVHFMVRDCITQEDTELHICRYPWMDRYVREALTEAERRRGGETLHVCTYSLHTYM